MTVLALAACGGSAPRPEPPRAGTPVATEPPAQSEAGGPSTPPPTVSGVRTSPPPAWIETAGGKHWLAFSSYCWSGTCLDARPPEQRTDIPEVEVRSGEEVRFHLGFEPSQLQLVLGSATHDLASGRTSTWSVRGESGMARLAARRDGSSADYLARLMIR